MTPHVSREDVGRAALGATAVAMVWLAVSLLIQDQSLVMAASGALAGAFGWFAAALVIGAFR